MSPPNGDTVCGWVPFCTASVIDERNPSTRRRTSQTPPRSNAKPSQINSAFVFCRGDVPQGSFHCCMTYWY